MIASVAAHDLIQKVCVLGIMVLAKSATAENRFVITTPECEALEKHLNSDQIL
jgi:hypothetical protein